LAFWFSLIVWNEVLCGRADAGGFAVSLCGNSGGQKKNVPNAAASAAQKGKHPPFHGDKNLKKPKAMQAQNVQ
jgi:hypothetical protein